MIPPCNIAANSILSAGSGMSCVLSRCSLEATLTSGLPRLPSIAINEGMARGARDILRQVPRSCQWWFDVVAVYYEHGYSQPSFELFQNAFPVSYNRAFGTPTERI